MGLKKKSNMENHKIINAFYMDTQGKLQSPNRRFDFVDDFYNGYAKVRLNNKWNLIDTQGNLISPSQWFDDVYNFSNRYAKVKLNNKWNFIDMKGIFTA